MNFATGNKFGRQTEIIYSIIASFAPIVYKHNLTYSKIFFADNSAKKIDTPEVCNGSVTDGQTDRQTDRQTDGRTDRHIIAPPNPLGLLITL